MVVTFCGHHDVQQSDMLYQKLKNTLRKLIAEGADTFLLGGYGAFDIMAASVVHELKREYPHIRSTLVIPYLNCDDSSDLYDDTLYPPLESIPRRFAILRRNEWMIGRADVVISYVTHDWGGAASSLRYAKRKHKRIISLEE